MVMQKYNDRGDEMMPWWCKWALLVGLGLLLMFMLGIGLKASQEKGAFQSKCAVRGGTWINNKCIVVEKFRIIDLTKEP
jgi:hypothetical protein